MWIFTIIGLFLIYLIIMEHKDAKNSASKATHTNAKKPSASGSVSDPFGYTYGSYSARSLCSRYEKALDSHNSDALLKTVEEMIGDHWASVYSEDYESASLFESVAAKRPYIYPDNGPRSNCRGLSLIEIFRNNNVEIRARKEGKAPYTTSLPYKHK